MKAPIKSLLIAIGLFLSGSELFAQAPNLSYASSPASLLISTATGTLNITNGGGTVLTGTIAYNATPTQPLTSGSFSGPARGAVDAAGNIYIANYNGNTISKFSSTGTLISNNYTTGATLSNPGEIVFDSSGNMWVINAGASLQKYTAAGAWISTTALTAGGTTLGMCIDASDNLYITTYGTTDRIIKVTPALVQSNLVSGGNLNDPVEIAISGTNLYILNMTGSNITIYNTSNGVVTASFANSLGTQPYGLAVDAINGYVYASNLTAGTIRVYAVGTGTNVSPVTTISSVGDCRGLIVDGKGNVYAPNFTTNLVYRYFPTNGAYFLNKTLPTGLTFTKSTGAISGTPTVSTAPTDFIISGYNATGGSSATLNLNVYSKKVWNGSTSAVWSLAGNWTGGVPATWDQATIGNTAVFGSFLPIITSTVNVGSIIMGTFDNGTAASITVNSGGILNVTNDITLQSDANSQTNNAFIASLATTTGTGTINAANLKIIASNGLSATYTMKLTSSVSNLNISGDISQTASYINSRANNTSFTISSGTVTATDWITSNGGNAASTSTLAMTGGTLNFTDPTALAGLSSTGTNTITLSAGSTIGYTASSAQTIYTNTAITGLPSGISYQNIAFSGSGIKTAPSGSLNVAGSFTNTLANDASNYLDFTGATVSFNGGTQSLLGGSGNGIDFKNVTFTGTSTNTKTITSGKFNVLPTGILTIAGTNTTLAAGSALLTLESDANGSATLGAIPSGGSITGNVNVERYISGGQSYSRGYRLISSPVSVATNTIWPNLTYISAKTYTTGTAGGGFDATGNPTMYLYREDIAPNFTTFISGNSRGVAKINNSTASNFNIDTDGGPFTIPAGNGLLLFFRGDKATTTNPTVTSTIAQPTIFTATGVLNQGNVVVKDWFTPGNGYLSYTSGTPTSVRGYNLVGNPYASAVNWDLIYPTLPASINSTIYVYNPKYKAYAIYTYNHGGTGTNFDGSTANILPSGQGFYVQTSNISPSPIFTFTEAHKVNTVVPSANILLASAPVGNPLQYLRVKVSKDSLNKDEALIFFNPNANNDFVLNEDAKYLRGNNLVAISTRVTNNDALAINEMPYPTLKQTVNLNVIVSANGTYLLSVPELKDIPAKYNIWLKDALKNDSVNVKNTPIYSFDAVLADTTTFKRRFSLVIGTDPGNEYVLVDFKGDKNLTSVLLSWTTKNEGNTTHFTVERSNDGGQTYTVVGDLNSSSTGTYNLTDNSPKYAVQNLYRLKQIDAAGIVSYSALVPITYSVYSDIIKSLIKAYPNPARSVIKVLLTEVKNKNGVASDYSNYTITITNNQGTAVRTFNVSQPDSWEGDINSFASGIYFIKVYNNNTKTIVGNSKFVKL